MDVIGCDSLWLSVMLVFFSFFFPLNSPRRFSDSSNTWLQSHFATETEHDLRKLECDCLSFYVFRNSEITRKPKNNR